jgi:hypothetical protein
MPENALKVVIEAESEIRAMLDAEQRRADAWLEEVRRETEAQLRAGLDHLAEESGREEEAARAEAAAAAEAIVRRAADLARRLEETSDAELARIVRRCLRAIVPQAGHDHPDGQG